MTLIDWPEYVELDVEYLRAEGYQREVNERRVRKMVREFDPKLFGALTVATVDGGGYAVIDGRHRWSLATLMTIDTVWAQLHEDLDYEARARLFVELQAKRQNLTTVDRFLAMREAQDERTLDIDEILGLAGLVVHRNPDHPDGVRAITALEEAYRRGTLKKTLATVSAWPSVARYRTHTEIIRGLCRFYAKHPDVTSEEFTALLDAQGINPLALRGLASDIRSEGGDPKGKDDNAMSMALMRLWKAFKK